MFAAFSAWWQTWEFAQPAWFWLLAAWVFLQVFFQLAGRFFNRFSILSRLNSSKSGNLFFHPSFARFVANQSNSQQYHAQPDLVARIVKILSYLLALAVMVLLLATLAQPQKQIPKPQIQLEQPARDIALVVESSVSMVLADYQINQQPTQRIQVVRQVLQDFVAQLSANRFSLVLYADQAFTLVPMTADAQVLQFELQRLQPYLAGRGDSAMGEGLGLALKNMLEKQQDSTKKQLLVLVSDGLQQASKIDLHQVALLAKQNQIPIFTIGIGAGSTTENTPAKTAGLLYQELESASLQFLAKETGGEFYQVAGATDLSAVLQKIEQTSAVATSEKQQTGFASEDLYFYPLAWALALLLIWWLLRLVKRDD